MCKKNRRVILFLTACVGLSAPAAASAQAKGPAEDSAQAIHLLNRATFGIRGSDLAAVLASGRDKWLDRQLHPERIPDTLVDVLAKRYPVTTASMRDLYRDYAPPSKAEKAARAQMKADTTMMSADDAAVKGKRSAGAKAAGGKGNSPQAMLGDIAAAKLERAALSDRQLEEVMTDFWFNHFNVFFQKGADRYLIADYERNAIRPHVFGKFEDLLTATAQHPAMLFYLDNWQSVHIDSTMRTRMARAPQLPAQAKDRGLNENYARELLELHTLGVDGGYTQQDVINVARALTGWTFIQPRPGAAAAASAFAARGRGGRNGRGGDTDVDFVFRDQLHDKGAKTVLGHNLPAGRGIEDGREVLHILSTSPVTAHFIASKLVEYFVNDSPEPKLVDHVASVFLRTGGDLREVTRTLFSDPLFYAAANRRAKVKTPFQLIASTLRTTDAQMVNPRGVIQTLRTMGQLPYMSSPPTGYPAMSEDWVNSGALLARMNFGIDYASGKVPGVYPNARSIVASTSPSGDGTAALHSTTAKLLPGVDAAKLESAIIADIATQKDTLATPRAKVARMIGLVIGSPEFQRH